jgi:hypothetical protein
VGCAGQHGSSAPRAEVAETIWFASGLSGGISQATVTVAETALTATGERCSVPCPPPAIAQALALQAMQSSVITISETPRSNKMSLFAVHEILDSAATRVGRNEVKRRISVVENPALRY